MSSSTSSIPGPVVAGYRSRLQRRKNGPADGAGIRLQNVDARGLPVWLREGSAEDCRIEKGRSRDVGCRRRNPSGRPVRIRRGGGWRYRSMHRMHATVRHRGKFTTSPFAAAHPGCARRRDRRLRPVRNRVTPSRMRRPGRPVGRSIVHHNAIRPSRRAMGSRASRHCANAEPEL